MENKKAHAVCGKIRYPDISADCGDSVPSTEYCHIPSQDLQIDWISQHTVLAEYFRQRFYSTHEFFPQFASELGGGQNIYNFAYYGLYSPLVLLSYAFPFLSMEMWFQIMGILTYTADRSVMFPLAEPPSEEAVQHLRGNVFDVFFCCGVPYLRTGYVCGLPALSSAHADRGGYSPENEG